MMLNGCLLLAVLCLDPLQTANLSAAQGRVIDDRVVDDRVVEDKEVLGARVDMSQGIERPYHEISRDMRAFFKRESLAKETGDQISAVLDLCQLYGELMTDQRLSEAPVLEGYRVRIRSRLLKVQKEISRRVARREKEIARLQQRAEREGVELEPQQLQSAEITASDLADQISLFGEVYGGPVLIFSEANGAFGGGMFDYGDDLVALIERTIAPDTWDVVGGPGHIEYYRPSHALVISATSEVHHQVQGLLEALRRVSQ